MIKGKLKADKILSYLCSRPTKKPAVLHGLVPGTKKHCISLGILYGVLGCMLDIVLKWFHHFFTMKGSLKAINSVQPCCLLNEGTSKKEVFKKIWSKKGMSFYLSLLNCIDNSRL